MGKNAQGNAISDNATRGQLPGMYGQASKRPHSSGGCTMKIIPRYVLKHFLPIFALAISGFVGIYLIVDFFEHVDQMLENNLPSGRLSTPIFSAKFP